MVKASNSIEELLANSSDSFKHNTMQITAFKILGTDTTFGINVNKVISFVRWEDCHFSLNVGSSNQGIIGLANVRGETYPLVSFESWLELPFDINDYENVILCEFNRLQIAFPVKSIQRIYNKTSSELEKSDLFDGKITYITKIEKESFSDNKLKVKLTRLKKKKRIKELHKKELTPFMISLREKEEQEIKELEKKINSEKFERKEELCLVLDVETLISDLFKTEETLIANSVKNIKHNFTKKLLIAEDSKAATAILRKLLSNANIEYQFFTNGKDLLDFLEKTDLETIGVIISDIEMPEMDGFTLLKNIKEKYGEFIPVVMNSSMSNRGVHDKVKALGAEGFIPKTDPEAIVNIINKYC